MRDVHERVLAAPLSTVWETVVAAQGRPGLLGDATDEHPAPRRATPVTVASPDGARYRGYLRVLDADDDQHVATLDFAGTAPGRAETTRIRLRAQLEGAGSPDACVSCTLRLAADVRTSGEAGDVRTGAALAGAVADALEARCGRTMDQRVERAGQRAQSAVAAVAAVSVAAIVLLTVRALRGHRPAGQRSSV